MDAKPIGEYDNIPPGIVPVEVKQGWCSERNHRIQFMHWKGSEIGDCPICGNHPYLPEPPIEVLYAELQDYSAHQQQTIYEQERIIEVSHQGHRIDLSRERKKRGELWKRINQTKDCVGDLVKMRRYMTGIEIDGQLQTITNSLNGIYSDATD